MKNAILFTFLLIFCIQGSFCDQDDTPVQSVDEGEVKNQQEQEFPHDYFGFVTAEEHRLHFNLTKDLKIDLDKFAETFQSRLNDTDKLIASEQQLSTRKYEQYNEKLLERLGEQEQTNSELRTNLSRQEDKLETLENLLKNSTQMVLMLLHSISSQQATITSKIEGLDHRLNATSSKQIAAVEELKVLKDLNAKAIPDQTNCTEEISTLKALLQAATYNISTQLSSQDQRLIDLGAVLQEKHQNIESHIVNHNMAVQTQFDNLKDASSNFTAKFEENVARTAAGVSNHEVQISRLAELSQNATQNVTSQILNQENRLENLSALIQETHQNFESQLVNHNLAVQTQFDNQKDVSNNFTAKFKENVAKITASVSNHEVQISRLADLFQNATQNVTSQILNQENRLENLSALIQETHQNFESQLVNHNSVVQTQFDNQKDASNNFTAKFEENIARIAASVSNHEVQISRIAELFQNATQNVNSQILNQENRLENLSALIQGSDKNTTLQVNLLEPNITCQSNQTTIANMTTQSVQVPIPLVPSTTKASGSTVKLIQGDGFLYGHVVVTKASGETGYICDDDWDDQDALVVCRQLGFSNGFATVSSFYGALSNATSFGMDNVRCTGKESNILDCPYGGWGTNSCGMKEVAGVLCYLQQNRTRITLKGGNGVSYGHVFVTELNTGRSGYVCDDAWDDQDAAVVCRQLGFKNGFAKTRSFFGTLNNGTSYAMDDVICLGKEADILQCRYSGWGNHNCNQNEAAGVVCENVDSPLSRIRLVSGDGFSFGHVTVTDKRNGKTGHVCDGSWDDKDASVVCRQLGFQYGWAMSASPYGILANGTVFAMDQVKCTGNEIDILQCGYLGWGSHNCGTRKAAGVICRSGSSQLPQVMLESSSNSANGHSSGHVKVAKQGKDYGYVCDDSWDDQDATVVCRQLGFRCGRATDGSTFGTIPSTKYFLDNVECTGTDTDLLRCKANSWGSHDCSVKEAAGVRCYEKS